MINENFQVNDEVITGFLNSISPLMDSIKGIYLFGSRCRDDWRPDSDYDILIVFDKKERQLIDRCYDAVMDVLLETGKLVSLKIFSLSEFNHFKSIPTPFIENVLKEGVQIGKQD